MAKFFPLSLLAQNESGLVLDNDGTIEIHIDPCNKPKYK